MVEMGTDSNQAMGARRARWCFAYCWSAHEDSVRQCSSVRACQSGNWFHAEDIALELFGESLGKPGSGLSAGGMFTRK